MSKIVLILVALIAFATINSGCEKTDYKHPLHRANGK
jgi:hypothetical protein